MEPLLMKMDIFTIQEEYYQEGKKILNTRILYPQFISKIINTKELNEKYYNNAINKKRYSDTVLYPSALEAYHYHSAALPYELLVTIALTLQNNQYISFYQEEYTFTGGANGNTIRTGQTIDVLTGTLKQLCDFVKDKGNCYSCIKKQVIKQIETSEDPSNYFEDYKTLVEENFDPRNFYLTKEGIIVFFAVYDIAPHSTGIPTFLIPYNQC